jgi:hypothetical protein
VETACALLRMNWTYVTYILAICAEPTRRFDPSGVVLCGSRSLVVLSDKGVTVLSLPRHQPSISTHHQINLTV